MTTEAAAQTLISDTQRVIYDKNPLECVICQLRFPDILRIGSEPPANFQEQIRELFPFYKEPEARSALELPAEIPLEIRSLIGRALLPERPTPAQFISSDGKWLVSLATAFLALSTTEYIRWEEFKAKLAIALKALMDGYKPAFFTRIGLRYKDVIRKNFLGLQDCKWSELITPYILGELAEDKIASATEEATRKLLLKWGEKSKLRLTHGLEAYREELCYVIDCDFFTNERVEKLDNAITILDDFNRSAGNFFRWCIQERLEQAMGPSPVRSRTN